MRESDHHIVDPHQGVHRGLRKRLSIRQRESGAFAVMTALLLLVIFAFCGLAIDLSRLYNRKVELQTAADAIAIAAAKELDGTDAGVGRALAAAAQTANRHFYAYNFGRVVWLNDAIRFGASPYGNTWLDETTARQASNAAKVFFVQVNTNKLAAEHGDVQMFLPGLLPADGMMVHVGSTAIAGRSSINVMPLALCAMSDTDGEARGTELVEYGFRRGISYNLMKLNPKDDTMGTTYLINPLTLPGATGASVSSRMDVVRPFVCTGTLAIPTLAGGPISVESGFPLSAVYQQLNSRFGSYTAPCNPMTAPPDTNIKEFTFSSEFPWMDSQPTAQAAETRSRASPKQLLTVADLPPSEIPNSTTGGMYGPLWVYAQAVVKDSRYVSGLPEPASGYTKFSTNDWPTLYTPGSQKVKPGYNYQATPYKLLRQAPSAALKGVSERRLLHVPLLRCPVSGSPATAEVAAVAKFFMTVSATDNDLYAEFAGLAAQKTLTGQVELYP